MIKPHMMQLPIMTEFGSGASSKVGSYVKMLGKKSLIVTDKGVLKVGILKGITDALDESNLEYVIFDGVMPNPIDTMVEEEVRQLKQQKCDNIVAVGGGSSIDAAKGMALLATNPGRIADYALHTMQDFGKIKYHPLPYIAIPTTAGTGTEADCFAVITVVERKTKEAVGQLPLSPGGPHLGAKVALVDPNLTLALPAAVTASTGMDALAHAIETYIGKSTAPFIEALSLRSIELVGEHLRVAYADGGNYEAREGMMMASHLAGYGENYVGTCAEHALAEATGGMYGSLAHGVLVSLFLRYTSEYNRIAVPQKFAKIATALGENVHGLSMREASSKGVEAINDLIDDLQIRQDLKSLGVEERSLPGIAERAFVNTNTGDNPRTITREEYLRILKLAYEGA